MQRQKDDQEAEEREKQIVGEMGKKSKDFKIDRKQIEQQIREEKARRSLMQQMNMSGKSLKSLSLSRSILEPTDRSKQSRFDGQPAEAYQT